mmetsp:Transcript_18379/g.29196  ORF Transcript_18379/g.29196 Transcript_18379/m.29196 type:complete len:119 (+) Transcript_18379:76-432(+)
MASMPVPDAIKKSVIEFDSQRPANAGRAPHPLQSVHNQILHKQRSEFKERLAKMYGTHAAFRQDMDEYVLKQSRSASIHRGVPFGLDVLLGRDGNIDQFDYLGGTDPMKEQYRFNRFD